MMANWHKSLVSFFPKGILSLAQKYRDVELPSTAEWDIASAKRVFFEEGDQDLPYYPKSEEGLPQDREYRTDSILSKFLAWDHVDALLRTSSSVHNYQAQHPEDKERRGKGKEGDVVERFVAELQEKLPDRKEGIDVYWPLFLVMIKRASSE